MKSSLAAAKRDCARRLREHDEVRIGRIQRELRIIAARHKKQRPCACERIATAISWLNSASLR